jgi:RNA polymerase sigma factor (sigma-70 family)
MVINLVKDYFGSAYYRRSKFQGQNDYDSEGFIENNPGIANGPQPESVIQSITLMHMISGLRDIEKTIIHYYYFQGYKEREIAEMMKYPLNTISSIKNRALKKLKISWQAN